MHHLAVYSLVALAALVLFKVIQRLAIRRQHALIKKQLGCQDPPVDPHSGFLGINAIRTLTKADREGRLPDFVINRHRTLNQMFGRITSTVSHNILGQNILFTNDPKNIQAMLATQFSDYDLGETRNSLMGLTLGSGIVCVDCALLCGIYNGLCLLILPHHSSHRTASNGNTAAPC
ncbi:hypothetical protein MRB53_041548 [Persea americana]|nr:hypothetical protein MRB53_041548 [Persea americana]